MTKYVRCDYVDANGNMCNEPVTSLKVKRQPGGQPRGSCPLHPSTNSPVVKNQYGKVAAGKAKAVRVSTTTGGCLLRALGVLAVTVGLVAWW